MKKIKRGTILSKTNKIGGELELDHIKHICRYIYTYIVCFFKGLSNVKKPVNLKISDPTIYIYNHIID